MRAVETDVLAADLAVAAAVGVACTRPSPRPSPKGEGESRRATVSTRVSVVDSITTIASRTRATIPMRMEERILPARSRRPPIEPSAGIRDHREMCRAFLLALLLPHAAWAAVSAQALTPSNTSVMGGERQVYSVRFFDALGQPAVGESVLFANDACGFFDNGGFSTTVLTDTSGVATAGFTARPQGITCWVTAHAGVQVVFNVFTYTLGQVGLTGSTTPAEPRPGQSFTFTGGAFAGVYPIYDARVDARVVPSGAATIATVAGGGQPGRSDFTVTPLGFEPFEIEVSYRGLTRRFAAPVPGSPLQDMWWSGPMENGWGMSVVQHGDRLFAAIYTYDAAGAPTWYVMPGGTWNGAHTAFTGALYSPRGSPYTAYDASHLRPGEPVGSATITFNAVNAASLDFTIGAVGGRKAITRQLFGPPE